MNQKTIILTEKPSVARDFASALSTNYKNEDGYIELEKFIITWAIGHLLTPYDPEDYDKALKKWSIETLPIIPIKFHYKSIKETKKQLEVIKKLFKRTDVSRLIVATDAGREGELIARLILEEVKNKFPALRFFTSDALTKDVILKELKNSRPLKDYDRLYIAGRARQRADWIVGMNLSRAVSIKMGDLFSVGRVQTAVLDLIVERRKEIDQFIPTDYFELKAQFKFNNEVLHTHWFDPNKKLEERRKDKKEDFERIVNKIKNQKAIVSKKEELEKIVYPEGLFSLTDLQRKANQEYGFSASKTLDLAQSLYEKYKVLSYPRTESRVMGSASLDLVKSLVYRFKDSYPEYFEKFAAYKVSLKNRNVFDDSRLTDHHGLIPLKEFKGSSQSDEGKIYYLVLKRFITNFLENHKYLQVKIEVQCEGENFHAEAKKILEMGFKEIDEKLKDDVIVDINQGDVGIYDKSEIDAKKTRPPFEYTEASLLYDMTNPARLVDESELKKIFRTEIGLGTQATRANIIETLIRRKYIKRSGKNLIAEEKGIELVNKLKSLEVSQGISSVKETARWEIELSLMAQGENSDEKFLDTIADFVTESVLEWKKEETSKNKNESYKEKYSKKFKTYEKIGECPICQKDVLSFPKSYSCSGWKNGCQFTIWKTVAQAKISLTEAKYIIANKKSHLIKNFKSKNGKKFEAILVLNNEGKLDFQFQN